MKLSHKELEIQSGQFGEVRKLALEHQIQVGKFFDAQSFVEISKNYSLYPIMTGSTVMCISKKVADFFKSKGWKKIEVFNPGDELLKL